MRSATGFINSRIVPLFVVGAFMIIMVTYSQAQKLQEGKNGSRDLAITFPRRAYQATYEMKADPDSGVMLVYSDGIGHVRVEANSEYSKSPQVTIYDFAEKKKYFLQEQAKTYMVSGMSSLGMGFMDEWMFRSTGAEALGERDINGRTAEGYRSAILGDGNSQIESWFDQETGCLMTSKTKTTSYVLTRCISAPSRPELYQVPKDYKEIPLGF